MCEMNACCFLYFKHIGWVARNMMSMDYEKAFRERIPYSLNRVLFEFLSA